MDHHECKAYKPWIRTEDASGNLQKACQVCPYLGRCEWTGEGPDPDLWGFQNGAEPGHEDVAGYFTRKNYLQMFGVPFAGTDEDLETMKAHAHSYVEALQDARRERV